MLCENNEIRTIACVNIVGRRSEEYIRDNIGTEACLDVRIVKRMTRHMVRMKDDRLQK